MTPLFPVSFDCPVPGSSTNELLELQGPMFDMDSHDYVSLTNEQYAYSEEDLKQQLTDEKAECSAKELEQEDSSRSSTMHVLQRLEALRHTSS